MPKPKKFPRLLSILAVLATLPLARVLAKYMDADLARLLASQLADWIMVGITIAGTLVAAKLKIADNLKVAELLAQQVEDGRPKNPKEHRVASDLKGLAAKHQ